MRILVTGGTFDKEYHELTGELVFKKSNILKMLEQARSEVDTIIEEFMLIDSLYMVDEDRQKILKACQRASEEKIIITHGTDTMVETARVLANGKLNKTIVLVGAMIPYSMGNSDALFNLGFALAAVQLLDKGVFIAMNGKVFEWDKVKKNKQLGVFQSFKNP